MIFASFWPSALQLSIAWGSILALCQTRIFKSPRFREYMGLQPFPSLHAKSATGGPGGTLNTGTKADDPAERKSRIDVIRRAWNDVIQQGKETQKRREKARTGGRVNRTEAEMKKAKAYEEKRMRQAAQKRFEDAQERQERDDDRRRQRNLR